jgi:molecular chaperone GrpE (heat shock protein)
MSIRMIAKELYHLQQEVEKLEAQIESVPSHEREALKDRLRRLKAERDRMRKTLNGAKVPPPFRQPL